MTTHNVTNCHPLLFGKLLQLKWKVYTYLFSLPPTDKWLDAFDSLPTLPTLLETHKKTESLSQHGTVEKYKLAFCQNKEFK